jgi:hypothetical protein
LWAWCFLPVLCLLLPQLSLRRLSFLRPGVFVADSSSLACCSKALEMAKYEIIKTIGYF